MRPLAAALLFGMVVGGCGSSEPTPEPGSGTAAVATPTTTTATKLLDEAGPMTLSEALDLLTRSAGANVWLDPSVNFEAPIDADVRRRANATGSWRAALDLVAASAGYVVVERGDRSYEVRPR